ncbi:MAG TPA: iron-sulfur cluster assembly scaffold protein [Terriglobales bacterium]|nr:iron-sulfur cluster assembly scaffold protein [Terriglobales bacterium]
MFSPQLLAYFERAACAGTVPAPAARIERENPVCGDHLVLSARLDAAGGVAELRYLCRGCVAAMGCAAAFTELLAGQPLARLAAFSERDLLTAVGSLPPASRHAAALVLDARDALLAALRPRSRPDAQLAGPSDSSRPPVGCAGRNCGA